MSKEMVIATWLCVMLLPLTTLHAQKKTSMNDVFEKHEFKSNNTTLPYRMLKPDHLSVTKKVPLVVFLHGAGERGDDNQLQLKHGASLFASEKTRTDYPAVVIFPQCPKGKWWSGEHLKNVLALITELKKKHPIDPKRVYITGVSMGGFGSWAAISAEPDTFAAAAPICGGGNPAKADRIKDIPIWAFHGADDTVVKPEKSREMIEAIKKAGGSPTYTEYPKVKHNSWNKVFKDPEYLSWLFSQKKK